MFLMRKNHKKSTRDKARIEECNRFEMSDVEEYDDMDNAKNINFLVDKINRKNGEEIEREERYHT